MSMICINLYPLSKHRGSFHRHIRAGLIHFRRPNLCCTNITSYSSSYFCTSFSWTRTNKGSTQKAIYHLSPSSRNTRNNFHPYWLQFSTSTTYTTTSEDNLHYDNDEAIAATKKWFETIVIGQKLCPFAPPFQQNKELIRFAISNAANEKDAILDVQNQVKELIGDESTKFQHETTLIIFNHPSLFLKEYRNLIHLSWTLQEEIICKNENFVNQLQFVLFHPKATHQTYSEMENEEDDTAAANYTIRSPFPTIHLLREEDVLRAVKGNYPDLESLPSRNKFRFVKQGIKTCKDRFDQCYSNASNQK